MARTPLTRKNKRLEAYLLMNESRYKPANERRAIDLESVRALAAIGATQAEMAIALGTSVGWLERETEKNPAMAIAVETGYTEMKHSLRRAQLAMALSGSAAMLIWLGKQHLGQSDKQDIESNTTININVQRAMDELRNIPKDQLLAAQALLSAPALEHEPIKKPD